MPHNRTMATRLCVICSTPFVTRPDYNSRTCSSTCKGKFQRKLPESIACRVCGQAFKPTTRRQVSCNQACYGSWTPERRLWPRIDRSDANGCWWWLGSRNNKGYGMIGSRSFGDGSKCQQMLVHRLVYELTYGPIHNGLHCLHRCDNGNKGCVRPDHLFLGTNLDNILDRVAKGRSPRGEQRSLAKLTAEKVRDMRLRYAAGGHSYNAIAREESISVAACFKAISGETWSHVTPLLSKDELQRIASSNSVELLWKNRRDRRE